MGYTTPSMSNAVRLARWLACTALLLGFGLIAWALLVLPWDESGLGLHVLESTMLFYMLPGVLLLLFAWRMEKLEMWAFVATTGIAVAFLVKYMFALIFAYGGKIQFYESPIICETVLRIPSIGLLIFCLNSLPEVRDEYRNRRRRRNEMRQGFEPIMKVQVQTRTPPRPGILAQPANSTLLPSSPPPMAHADDHHHAG